VHINGAILTRTLKKINKKTCLKKREQALLTFTLKFNEKNKRL